MNERFSDLNSNMNARFSEMNANINARVDDLFDSEIYVETQCFLENSVSLLRNQAQKIIRKKLLTNFGICYIICPSCGLSLSQPVSSDFSITASL